MFYIAGKLLIGAKMFFGLDKSTVHLRISTKPKTNFHGA